ncbi:orexin receptor type 2-like [Dreissena polymorpha]|uniref:G-protein coupled receptors family 1 profile domain-containing protein n=1 Tax=Dreissena polymorpha TaxID=45954 RepID=A0A9D4R0Q0_DREPO|nr:orexin receptor type 2-like [Dreissena polymorpha]KAH3850619.1 hypothetical protein DPMN_093043 [Dreissena polymorpha]
MKMSDITTRALKIRPNQSDFNATSLEYDFHGETTHENDLIWELNKNKVIVLLPVIVYVILSVVVGIIGNTFVCYIYWRRLRRSPSRIFILFLALLDLISCVVGAGSELIDLFQPYVFTAVWSCKLLRFGLSFTIIAASFTLICVAFDRYYKVCRPLDAFPIRKVKTLCIVVATLSFVLAFPAVLIFGIRTVDTGTPGLKGTECSTQDSVKGTLYPVVYYIILFLAFLILLGCFILLYIRIGSEIWKRKRLTIGESLPDKIKVLKERQSQASSAKQDRSVLHDDPSSRSGPTDDESRGSKGESRAGCENLAVTENVSMNSKKYSAANGDDGAKRPLKRRTSSMGRMSIRTVRTTTIFFAVSVAFVVSFLPYLIANILKFTKAAFYEIHSDAEEVVYNFCVRSYFISNFMNPIIYSMLNINFRRECKKLLKRIMENLKHCCMCQRKNEMNIR